MTKKLSEQGANDAELARIKKGFKKCEDRRLTTDINVSASTLKRFWNWRNCRIDDSAFDAICKQLGLDPEAVVDRSVDEKKIAIDVAKKVRRSTQYCQSVKDHHANIRVPDCSEPVSLVNIFTNVCLINRSQRNLSIPNTQALRMHLQADFSRVMLLGKPGSGKTTLLKYLALQYLKNEFQVEFVPIFVSIARFSVVVEQLTLEQFIIEQCVADGILEEDICVLMKHGKLLVLLDGLNESHQSKTQDVITALDHLFQTHRKNVYIVSCRKATCENRFRLAASNNFVDLEISDFDDQSIRDFVGRWFDIKDVLQEADEFMHYLDSDKRVRQSLASNPLLLTLLCSLYTESDALFDRRSFFNNQSDIYKAALEMLLERWDVLNQIHPTYEIERRYLTDLLSQIATSTFENQSHIFKEQDICEHLKKYLEHITDSDRESMESLNARKFLEFFEGFGLLTRKSFGQFSFSHPIFQEYLTAQNIVFGTSSNNLQKLVNNVFDKRWKEVFLLVSEMLPRPDELLTLMSIRINCSISEQVKLQEILAWLDRKTCNIPIHGYELACIRATYLEEVFDQRFSCAFHISNLDNLPYDLKLDSYLGGILFLALLIGNSLPEQFAENLAGLGIGLDQAIDEKFANDVAYLYDREQISNRLDIFSTCCTPINKEQVIRYTSEIQRVLTILITLVEETELNKQLRFLNSRVPKLSQIHHGTELSWNPLEWRAWAEKLRSVLVRHRDIAHSWNLTSTEFERLREFYNANLLLVDCLKKNAGIAAKVRSQIMNTLLLPANATLH